MKLLKEINEMSQTGSREDIELKIEQLADQMESAESDEERKQIDDDIKHFVAILRKMKQ